MSRGLGALVQEHREYLEAWDKLVIYYDNGQREITDLVNSVFNALLTNVEVRKVIPADYSLFQAADLCCTLALLQAKLSSTGLSKSESDFFSTPKSSAPRALKKGYLTLLERQRFSG